MWKGVGPVRRVFEWPISCSRAEWHEFQLRLCTIRDSKIPKKKGTVRLYALHNKSINGKTPKKRTREDQGPEDLKTKQPEKILPSCHPMPSYIYESTASSRLRLFHRPLCYCRWPDILRDGGPLWRPDLKFWCQDMGSVNHFVDWSRKWQRT